MPGAGSTGTPAGSCAPNRCQQRRSCSAIHAMPLMLGHHFRALRIEAFLFHGSEPLQQAQRLPPALHLKRREAQNAQGGLLSLHSDLAIRDLGPWAWCSSCSTGFFATSSSLLTRQQGTQGQVLSSQICISFLLSRNPSLWPLSFCAALLQ